MAGGRAVFLARGDAGAELWGTDGTPGGTRRLPLPCAHCIPGDADPAPLAGLAFFSFTTFSMSARSFSYGALEKNFSPSSSGRSSASATAVSDCSRAIVLVK